MSTKIVYNKSFGGFSLSPLAREALQKLGINDEYEVQRHDSRLVEVIEKLGGFANGPFANLDIWYLKGKKYIIEEYDGKESVIEPEDLKWVEVK